MTRRFFQTGDTVIVNFLSIDPSSHFITGNNYMEVQKQAGSTWYSVATDADWATRVRWRLSDSGAVAALEWEIPSDASAGRYRLIHQGFRPDGEVFRGTSGVFEVAPQAP